MSTMSGNGQQTLTFASGMARVALVTAAILLIPLVAMQFTNEVVWTLSDFVAAGILLGVTGTLYVALWINVSSTLHRVIFGGLIGLIFFLVWAELAVGIFRRIGAG
jgi:hypothetical protein